MYLFALLGIVLSVIFMTVFSGLGILTLIDFPSIILLIIINIPILISARLLKDFNNAFALTLSKKKAGSLMEIKRAIEAVTLSMKSLFYSGLFIFFMALIIILKNLSSPETLGPSLAVAILSFIYAIVLNLIMLPIKSKLNLLLIEFMQE